LGLEKQTKEVQMAHPNHNSKEQKKQLTASEVHTLVQQVMQEQWALNMAESDYEAQDIWDVVIAAAVEQLSLQGACDLLVNAPSGNTVRGVLKDMLSAAGGLHALERQMNQVLRRRWPKKLLRTRLPAAIDITEIPYHGQYDEDSEEIVRRGRAKSGTTHFFCFATLYVVKKHKRYTVAITLMRRADKAQAVLERLLAQGQAVGLRVKRLYVDRGFDNNGIVAFLKQQAFATIMPLVVRGKHGGSRALLVGRKSYTTTYTRKSTIYDAETLPLHIVCRYSKGRYKRHGVYYFAYIVIGQVRISPPQVAEEYRRRFGIETSYRLMNQVRARTTSRSAALRLFLMTVAFLLLNLWSYVKWQHLFVPHQRGPRQVLHHLLPLYRWRAWLWEMVKQRLGLSLVISIPGGL
jgi:putative transposase